MSCLTFCRRSWCFLPVALHQVGLRGVAAACNLQCARAFHRKNRPLQHKRRVIFHNVVRSSLDSRSPHWQAGHRRRRRQAAVAQGASRANHVPAQVHQMPEVFFCALPSAARAAARRSRCCGMFSVWASAPHAPLCGVRVPATGYCAFRYAHGPHVVDQELGCGGYGACDPGSREESAGAAAAARALCCALRLSCQCLRALCCVFDACCRRRSLVLRSVAAHRSGCAKRSAAFIIVCRLLLPPALQAGPIFLGRQKTETAFRCFAI